MKKLISTLHRWLGFPLGLLFVITFGTGCLTAVDELLQRFEHRLAKTNYVYRDTTIEEDAQALAIIVDVNAMAGDRKVRRITLPSIDKPYYQVVARGERWTYPIDQLHQAVHSKSNKQGFFPTVLKLHRNFLLGKDGFLSVEGKYYTAWVGLIALLLSLLGLWVWWPLRRGFAIKDLVPRGKKRKHFYYSHMTSGVLVVGVILLLGLTGASITYRTFTQQLFGIETNKLSGGQAIELDNNWQAWLQGAYAQMPNGAHLQQIRFPRQARGQQSNKPDLKKPISGANKNRQKDRRRQIIELRFHAPGDWLGLTGSKVKIDKNTSQLVAVVLFRDLPLSEKIYSILVPLHTGHNLPVAYVLVLLILSILGTVMVCSGVVSFVIKKRKWLKTKSTINNKPAMDIST